MWGMAEPPSSSSSVPDALKRSPPPRVRADDATGVGRSTRGRCVRRGRAADGVQAAVAHQRVARRVVDRRDRRVVVGVDAAATAGRSMRQPPTASGRPTRGPPPAPRPAARIQTLWGAAAFGSRVERHPGVERLSDAHGALGADAQRLGECLEHHHRVEFRRPLALDCLGQEARCGGPRRGRGRGGVARRGRRSSRAPAHLGSASSEPVAGTALAAAAASIGARPPPPPRPPPPRPRPPRPAAAAAVLYASRSPSTAVGSMTAQSSSAAPARRRSRGGGGRQS